MKQSTVHRQIEKWVAYFGVPKPRLNFMEYGYIDQGKMKILGTYQDGEIKLYEFGMTREVVKHEFIHYLRHRFGFFDIPAYFASPASRDAEELLTRKWTCRSWKNIKKSITVVQ